MSTTKTSFRNICENLNFREIDEPSPQSPVRNTFSPNSPVTDLQMANDTHFNRKTPPMISPRKDLIAKSEVVKIESEVFQSDSTPQRFSDKFDQNHDYLNSEIEKIQKKLIRNNGDNDVKLSDNSFLYSKMYATASESIRNSLLKNHVSNSVAGDRISDHKLNVEREKPNNFMNGVNNFNNINHILSSGLLQSKELPFYINQAMLNSHNMNNGLSSPSTNMNNNLNLSMMTLSPPQTLSPHNKSNVNISLSSSSASPKEESQDEEDNETDAMRKFKRKRPREISPSNLRSHLQSQTSPPLTPLNNNSIDSFKRERTDRSFMSSNVHETSNGSLLNPINPFPYFNSPMSTAASIALLNHAKNSSFLRDDRRDYNERKTGMLPDHLSSCDGFRNGVASLDWSKDSQRKLHHQLRSMQPFNGTPAVSKDILGPDRSLSTGLSTLSDNHSASEKLITQQLSSTPPELYLKESTAKHKVKDSEEDMKIEDWNNFLKLRDLQLGVFAKMNVCKGTRYGPFLGKWTTVINDPTFAWEVSTVTYNIINVST